MIYFNGENLDICSLQCDVPQRSTFELLFFINVINDMFNHSNVLFNYMQTTLLSFKKQRQKGII